MGKVVDFRCLALGVSSRLQNETMSTHDILSIQHKIVKLENELASVDYTLKVGEKQFRVCRRRASPECPRSKFTVVGLWDRLARRILQLQVYMYKVRHGTQQRCGCLEDEE